MSNKGAVNTEPIGYNPRNINLRQRMPAISFSSRKVGILFKRGKRLKLWTKRLFILLPQTLVYFKVTDAHNQRGEIPITSTTKLIKIGTVDDKHGMRLVTDKGSHDLYANSAEELLSWITALKSLCVILFNFEEEYVILKKLGQGSFAEVHTARHIRTNRTYAVKSINKQLVKSSKREMAVRNEMEIMKELEHPNVITLYEVFESTNHIHLVLEYLRGGEVFDRLLLKGRFHEQEACLLMRNLLSAIAHMHSKKIVHRDLKPENLILVSAANDYDVKIADFGLAQKIGSESLTQRCGSPGYVAPEILLDEGYGLTVDIFSLGVIMYLLLSGSPAFYGDDVDQVLRSNVRCEVSFPASPWGAVSDSAKDLIKQLMQRNPANRASAADALRHPWITRMSNWSEVPRLTKQTEPRLAAGGLSTADGEENKRLQHQRAKSSFSRSVRHTASLSQVPEERPAVPRDPVLPDVSRVQLAINTEASRITNSPGGATENSGFSPLVGRVFSRERSADNGRRRITDSFRNMKDSGSQSSSQTPRASFASDSNSAVSPWGDCRSERRRSTSVTSSGPRSMAETTHTSPGSDSTTVESM
eukprot:GILJ01001807.1.p1 GENE.GILJ01001807.1~~GILJ01001807.1.p1  ORF type:complete len:588 (-),score=66.08 GILJ01001807.1:162-1925(-)